LSSTTIILGIGSYESTSKYYISDPGTFLSFGGGDLRPSALNSDGILEMPLSVGIIAGLDRFLSLMMVGLLSLGSMGIMNENFEPLFSSLST